MEIEICLQLTFDKGTHVVVTVNSAGLTH